MSVKRIGPEGRADVEAASTCFVGCVADFAADDEGSPSLAGGLALFLQLARIKGKQHRKIIEEDLKLVPWMRQPNYGCTGFGLTTWEVAEIERREFIHISIASAAGPTKKSA